MKLKKGNKKMSENLAPSVSPEQAQKWVKDPEQAEILASVEAPYREDATQLGKMITRANTAVETEQADLKKEISTPDYEPVTPIGGFGLPGEKHASALDKARRQAIESANEASDRKALDVDANKTTQA